MAKPLRVLIVEDAEDDCQLILRELRRGGFAPDHLRVQTDAELRAALAADGWDIVLSDFSLPGYSGLAVLRTLQESGLELPCIIVSGAIGEDAAVTAIRDGAHDYAMKDRLGRLPLAVQQQLAEASARRERRRMEEEVRRRNAELAGLQAISVAVSRSLDLRKVLEAALEETIRVLGAEAGAVFLSGPESDPGRPTAQRGFPEQALSAIAEVAAESRLVPEPEGARLLPLAREDPRPACCRLARQGWAELLAVALRARQGGLGLLLVASRKKGAFGGTALSLASGIGSQISVAAENARLHEQAQARNRYLEILQRINERLRSTLPLRDVLDIIAEGAAQAVEGVASLILVPDAWQASLQVGAYSGNVLLNAALKLTGRRVESYSIPVDGPNPAAVAYREGRLQEWSGGLQAMAADLRPEVPQAILPAVNQIVGARGGACLPLPAGNKTVGVLVLFSPRPQLTAQERLMLTGLADQGGLAVESARLFEETQRLQAFNESIVQGVAEAIFIQDQRGEVTFMNPAAESLLGTGVAGLKGRDWKLPPGAAPVQEAGTPKAVRRYETELLDSNGRPIPVIVSSRPLELEGHAAGILSACTDISERVRTERLLQTLNRAALAMARALTHEQTFAAVAEECAGLGCPCLLLLLDPGRQVLRLRHLSYGEEQVALFRRVTGVDPAQVDLPTAKVAEQWERLSRRETVVIQDGGRMLEAAVHGLGAAQAAELAHRLDLDTCIAAPLVTDSDVMGVFVVASTGLQDRDVPAFAALANQLAAAWHKNDLLLELRENLRELKKVQGQLIHAQKMEAIGRLAGGVAHDFNNQLTVILGNAEMLLEKARGDERMRQGIEEILNTAQRSAQLTQQLLAFSRKQFSRPVSLDPRELLHNMERMLRRLIGEDVELEFRLAPNTGWIQADPGQLEQVLMNLAVNARDAMPQGGRLLISSANSTLEQMSLLGQEELPPGRYVVLSVSDTGTGIEAGTLEHLFEPFFTTKPAGVGTGLGLAIVYGIVRQSGGSITVESEWGKGATFSIYLPCIEPPQPPAQKTKQAEIGRGRGETILLVEDEAALGHLLAQSLEAGGYRVLTAASSDEALQVAAAGGQPIQLLLSDIIMPGSLPRKEMIERLQALHPQLKVILMSGYTDEAITRQGVLQPGRLFLAKPFSLIHLLESVRGTLDGR